MTRQEYKGLRPGDRVLRTVEKELNTWMVDVLQERGTVVCRYPRTVLVDFGGGSEVHFTQRRAVEFLALLAPKEDW